MISLSAVICASALFGQISSSAIPMWEYLGKDEKMSYLYSMFANQVDEFCEFSVMKNCNQELLKYGLKKLKVMPENHLDAMDPYQRGAGALIWDSMMEGHEMTRATVKPRASTTTPKPNSYEDDQSFSDNTFGAEGAASAKIETVYRVPPPKGFVFTRPSAYSISSGTPQYKYPQTEEYVAEDYENDPIRNVVQAPLTGPMVVMVYPDGRPVSGRRTLPQDDDLNQYKMSKVRLPSL